MIANLEGKVGFLPTAIPLLSNKSEALYEPPAVDPGCMDTWPVLVSLQLLRVVNPGKTSLFP
jgi:hypothetical protein